MESNYRANPLGLLVIILTVDKSIVQQLRIKLTIIFNGKKKFSGTKLPKGAIQPHLFFCFNKLWAAELSVCFNLRGGQN